VSQPQPGWRASAHSTAAERTGSGCPTAVLAALRTSLGFGSGMGSPRASHLLLLPLTAGKSCFPSHVGSPALQQAATTKNKASQCQLLALRHAQAQSWSPFSVSSVFPLPTSFVSPVAYPAVSHRFHKNRACTVPLLHFSSLLSPPDTAAFPCCPCSEETQRSRVQPWPQLPRTPNFPGPLQFSINHLPAQPPRQMPSL